jgi:hypothetical protein
MTPSAAVAERRRRSDLRKCPLRGSLEARTHHMKQTHQAPSMKFGRACYVPYWRAPNNVFKSVERGTTAELTPAQLAPLLAEAASSASAATAIRRRCRSRSGTRRSRASAGWVGYTHQWKTCDPRLRDLLMASVESTPAPRKRKRPAGAPSGPGRDRGPSERGLRDERSHLPGE